MQPHFSKSKLSEQETVILVKQPLASTTEVAPLYDRSRNRTINSFVRSSENRYSGNSDWFIDFIFSIFLHTLIVSEKEGTQSVSEESPPKSSLYFVRRRVVRGDRSSSSLALNNYANSSFIHETHLRRCVHILLPLPHFHGDQAVVGWGCNRYTFLPRNVMFMHSDGVKIFYIISVSK